MIVLDTSALLAAANRADRNHGRVAEVFEREIGPLVLPVPILSEVGYMMEATLGPKVVSTLLDNIATARLSMDCCLRDATGVKRLVEKYSDMPLGVADAYVATCTCRNGGRVLTLDRWHFDVLSRELGFSIMPD